MTTQPQTPIQIHIPPNLRPFALPLADFQATHPTITNFATGTLIFLPTARSKLLLIQRAATERGFPNKWEIPGGSAEPSDPTILHSAARETFEETGLRLSRFVRQVGEGVHFVTGKGGVNKWLKLSFEIEVVEIDAGRRGGEGGGDGEDTALKDVRVTLDPSEHQAFAWASEEDVKGGKYAITTAEQRALMLNAFELRRGGGSKPLAVRESLNPASRDDGLKQERES